MTLKNVLAGVAVAALTATSAVAGGLAPSAPAETVVVPTEPETAPSSWGIILPILGAALLIGVAASSDK